MEPWGTWFNTSNKSLKEEPTHLSFQRSFFIVYYLLVNLAGISAGCTTFLGSNVLIVFAIFQNVLKRKKRTQVLCKLFN